MAPGDDLPPAQPSPAAAEVHASQERRGATLRVALAFVGGFGGLLLLAPVIDGLTARVLTMQSEYTVFEQASKAVLLLMMLVSLRAASGTSARADVATAGFTFVLALAMYLSESNMIVDRFQPVFGALLGIPVLMLLLRARAWAPLWLMSFGFFLIGSGAAADAFDPMSVERWLRRLIRPFARHEETFESIGTGLLGLAVLVRFLEPVRAAVRADRRAAASVGGAIVLLAIGDSLLHYQYRPAVPLRVAALVLAAAGFVALVWGNRQLVARGAGLQLGSEAGAHVFALAAFVVLPMIFGRNDDVVTLVLWPIVFVALGAVLRQGARAA